MFFCLFVFLGGAPLFLRVEEKGTWIFPRMLDVWCLRGTPFLGVENRLANRKTTIQGTSLPLTWHLTGMGPLQEIDLPTHPPTVSMLVGGRIPCLGGFKGEPKNTPIILGRGRSPQSNAQFPVKPGSSQLTSRYQFPQRGWIQSLCLQLSFCESVDKKQTTGTSWDA